MMANKILLMCLVFCFGSLVCGKDFEPLDKHDPEFKRMLFRYQEQKRGVCIDVRKSAQCEDMIEQHKNYCKSQKNIMMRFCAKTCNYCVSECKDEYDTAFCKAVSQCGHFCERNINQLAEKYCKKTCKLCDGSGKPPSPAHEECKDKRQGCKKYIQRWKIRNKNVNYNICESSYMFELCRKSCNKCVNDKEVMSDLSDILDLLDSDSQK